MVLLKFAREKQSRYADLQRPVTSLDSEESEDAMSYAAFLKDQGRKVGPAGPLDSNRYTHTYTVDRSLSCGPGGGNGAIIRRTSSLSNVVDLNNLVTSDDKHHERKMRVIEDHMFQHRHEERELKRAEGDITQHQRTLKRLLKQSDLNTAKQVGEQEKLMGGSNKQNNTAGTELIHKREAATKTRIDKNKDVDSNQKERVHKLSLTISDLQRKYRSKLSEIELKRIELESLGREFATKMKSNEMEQHALNQEIAELATSLNMEAQKKRALQDEITKTTRDDSKKKVQEDIGFEVERDQNTQNTDTNQRDIEHKKHELTLDQTRRSSRFNVKLREDNKKLQDNQVKLQETTSLLKQMDNAAEDAKGEHTVKKIDDRIKAHNMRRQQKLLEKTLKRRAKIDSDLSQHEQRFWRNEMDLRRRVHADQLKHVKKTYQKDSEIEQELYGKVKTSEFSRRKHEIMCQELENKLESMRRLHSEQIHEQISDCHREELSLEQQLVREKSELFKNHIRREESYQTLVKHREMIKEERHRLEEEQREHERLQRIGDLTDTMAQQGETVLPPP